MGVITMEKIKVLGLLSLFLSMNVCAKEVHIDIYKFAFTPSQITVKQGDTVIWTNKEKRQYHSVWFKQLFKKEPDYLFPDEVYQYTFNKLGSFPYECGPHPRMKGVIKVVVNK